MLILWRIEGLVYVRCCWLCLQQRDSFDMKYFRAHNVLEYAHNYEFFQRKVLDKSMLSYYFHIVEEKMILLGMQNFFNISLQNCQIYARIHE